MANYEKLDVFRLSYELALVIYKSTIVFPEHEKFGLVSQLRRAAYSVPLNIVEGNGRRHKKEKIQFFNHAKASNDEVHFLVRFAKDLGYFDEEQRSKYTDMSNRVSFMLTKLMKAMEN